MFDRILVGLDGSEGARKAGELALDIAAELGSRLTAVFVADARVVEGPSVETLAPVWGEVGARPFQPEVVRAYRDRGSRVLEAFASRTAERSLPAPETVLEFGVAEQIILERATCADLVVLGLRGEHEALGAGAMGSTLSRVLHRCSHPVLVAKGDGSAPRRLLVAYNSSEASIRALDLAIRYARVTGGELRVVHAGGEEAEPVLDRAAAVLRDHRVPWQAARLDSEPAAAVREALRRWEADCLFMGAFGRGRVRDLLFGSHTASILEVAAVPTFLTR